VLLLDRRGYAAAPEVVAGLCLGGPLSPAELNAAVAAAPRLRVLRGLVVERGAWARAGDIAERAAQHPAAAARHLPEALRFTRRLVAACPFVLSVSIAGSLASGGFRASDDVDLDLVVEDGYRHIAYVMLNLLGFLHALGHRRKPVDRHTARPLAPRFMTANLILERSECFPLARVDEDMAYELLRSEPVFGEAFLRHVIACNPPLLEVFPQLGRKRGAHPLAAGRRLPRRLFPRILDRPARCLGASAWRFMRWTRRHDPEALARVTFVRETMRPYTLFPEL